MGLFHPVVLLFTVASHANIIFNIPDNLPGNTNTLIFGVDVPEIWWAKGFAFPFVQA
jgi:hypothetical protein